MKSIIIVSLVDLALLFAVSQVIYAKDDTPEIKRIIVVPDTVMPTNGSLCRQYHTSDIPSDCCSTMTFTELIDSAPVHKTIKEVIFTSGMYFLNMTEKAELKYGNTGHMNFTGEGNVVINCISEFYLQFSNIKTLHMYNVVFENCSGTAKASAKESPNINGTLFVEARDYPGMVSLVNIRINNPTGKGIIVNFKELNVNDCHSFSLVNSFINTQSTGVSVQRGNKYISQHFNMSNVTFMSNESCFEMLGRSKTHTILNISLFGSRCKSSILSISSYGDKDNYKTKVTISNLNIVNSSSQIITRFNKPAITVQGQFQLINNTGTALSICSSSFQFFNASVNIHLNGVEEGSIVLVETSSIIFKSSTILFSNNHVGEGSIVLLKTSSDFKSSAILFSNNHVGEGSIVLVDDSSIVFNYSHIKFSNNRGQLCGGITAKKDSNLNFTKNTSAKFINNYGEQGGAISLYSKSLLVLDDEMSHLLFYGNQALKGGAIFIDDSTYVQDHRLQRSAIQGRSTCTGCLNFTRNTALLGGDNIYGGWVDWTVTNKHNLVYNSYFSEMIVEDHSGIASDPLRVCLCENGTPNCSIKDMELTSEFYPGQIIDDLQAVAVGQRANTVVTPITISTENGGNNKVKILQKNCTNLTYTISSPKQERVILDVLKTSEFGLSTQSRNIFGSQLLTNYPDKLGVLFKNLSIRIKVKRCPLAFSLDNTPNHFKCVCSPSLVSLGLMCDDVNYKIIRSAEQWIGITYNHTIAPVGLIAHQYCPHDYCKTTNESLSVYLENENEICAYNRRGILCGGCELNFSRVLGTSKCKKCSNIQLLAIIPGFLVSGMLLVIFLILLNLTVSSGTIGGLIFYANILQAQRANLFSPGTSFPSVFIGLLNLDQGFETCFYNGLDSYVETWLQFVFPIYIWLLVGLIILSSHYSTCISNLCGKNAVPVLATLFLLTYTKLLRLEMTVVSFTVITYPNGYTKNVWLYDGNVDYLKGKHIPLFIATVFLLVLLSVPYTLSLVGIQWLLRISHYRAMFWVQKLKPLFDAYTGPYRVRHRYWTGLLLLVRITLLVSFSLNQSNNPTINVFISAVVSTLLLVWLFLTGGVFESQLNNYLEVFFLCNLNVTSIATLYELSNKNSSPIVMYTSTGLAFVVFVGIVVYHALRQLLLTKVGAEVMKLFQTVYPKRDSGLAMEYYNSLQINNQKVVAVSPKKVTSTVVGLSQPLLESEEASEEVKVKRPTMSN